MNVASRVSRYGPVVGVGAQVTLLVTLAVGFLGSSAFSWPVDPFSVSGTTNDAVATAFNIGLVSTGLLSVVFAGTLWREWRPSVGLLYGLVGVSYVLAGAFPIGSGLHAVAAGIFVFGWLLLWWAGVDDWRSGNRRYGVTGIVLGTVTIGVWLPYDLGLDSLQIGYAAGEFVCFVALGLWTVGTARRLRIGAIARHNRRIVADR